MKFKRLAGLSLLAPLAVLCACGGTAGLSFTAKWYSDSSLVDNSADEKTERLEYKVEFVAPTSEKDFKVSYQTGTYATELSSEVYEISEGVNETVYVLTSELSISGNFTLGSETSETFRDVVRTKTYFRNIRKQLAPIKSERTARCTTPVQSSPERLEDAFRTYEYEYKTEYDANLTKATVSFTDLTAQSPTAETQEVELDSDKGTYLDNEQILFALRGLDLSGSSVFYSVNPSTRQTQQINVSGSSLVSETLNGVTIGGETKDVTCDAYKISLSYSGTHVGSTQTLRYATKTGNDNTLRAALIGMEVPIFYNMGTLRYTLVKADFINK